MVLAKVRVALVEYAGAGGIPPNTAAAATGAGSSLGITQRTMNQAVRPPVDIRASACPHDCPSTCALEVEVLDAYTIGRVRGEG